MCRPTLVSFAIAIGKASRVVSTEFKKPESTVVLIRPILDPETGCPNFFCLKANYKMVEQMIDQRAWWRRPVPWATAAWPRPCSRWVWATASASR